MNWALALSGKQLLFYVASDKNWAFKWKLGFWETCILSVFKGFSDKAGSDTNFFFLIQYNEMSTFGRST